MKPYCTHVSPRPGCPCCITSHGHGYRGKHASQEVRAAKRAGKKAVRQQSKKLTNEEE